MHSDALPLRRANDLREPLTCGFSGVQIVDGARPAGPVLGYRWPVQQVLDRRLPSA
jgi:hypothetical protein